MASRGDEATRVSHCEYSEPSIYSEIDSDHYGDCSSIISSMSYQSLQDCDLAIPTEIATMEEEESIPTCALDTALRSPPDFVNRLISVVSPSNTPFCSYDDLFDGTEMDDGMISLMSSTSSFIGMEQLRSIQIVSTAVSIPKQEMKPDLLLQSPDELICCISSFLDVKSLARFRCSSKRARLVASRDEAGWKLRCESLWSQKSFVLKEARLLYRSRNAMSAYRLATYDARHRGELRREELCFDPKTEEGIIWDFRFKETAGTDWTSFDPWWTGGRARKMVFLRDGTVKQISQSDGSSSFALFPPFVDTIQNTDRPANATRRNRSTSPCEITWRFVSKPMDLPNRPDGAYLRLTVDGRDVPTYVVHRSRTGDWGFVIESCWGVYSSTPLPRRQILNAHEPVTRTRMRLRRTRDGARWLNVNGIESDSEEEAELAPPHQMLHVDCNFSMSTRCQWREALLYNYGAISLPEGEHATAEFDRVWNQSFRHQDRQA